MSKKLFLSRKNPDLVHDVTETDRSHGLSIESEPLLPSSENSILYPDVSTEKPNEETLVSQQHNEGKVLAYNNEDIVSHGLNNKDSTIHPKLKTPEFKEYSIMSHTSTTKKTPTHNEDDSISHILFIKDSSRLKPICSHERKRKKTRLPHTVNNRHNLIKTEIGKHELMSQFERMKELILDSVPSKVKDDFMTVCFGKWEGEVYPALQVNPFEIRPGEVTNQWMSLYYKVSGNAAEISHSCPIL